MTPSDDTFHRSLAKLLVEIFDGPPGGEAYILNPGDAGLLRQLDATPAVAASRQPIPGHPSIAAHADHLHFGLTLLTRWISGEENPWEGADWNASWQRNVVSDEQWQHLRDGLRKQAGLWQKAFAARREWDDLSAAGALSSLAHTAYHLGAIRQVLAAG